MKSERLAEEGDVDGSILFANQAEGFKKQWDALHASITQPERTMTVCDICGVFINSTDNEQRRKVIPDADSDMDWHGNRVQHLHRVYGSP